MPFSPWADALSITELKRPGHWALDFPALKALSHPVHHPLPESSSDNRGVGVLLNTCGGGTTKLRAYRSPHRGSDWAGSERGRRGRAAPFLVCVSGHTLVLRVSIALWTADLSVTCMGSQRHTGACTLCQKFQAFGVPDSYRPGPNTPPPPAPKLSFRRDLGPQGWLWRGGWGSVCSYSWWRRSGEETQGPSGR